jgi:PAS domain S-box-containing protein
LKKLNLNLTQKGLALIAIPLIFEFIFGLSLALLQSQAEDEATRSYNSGRLNNSINQLVRDIFDLASLSRLDLPQLIGTSFEKRAQKIREDLDELKDAVKDDPAKAAIVADSAQASERCYKILGQLRYAYATGGALLVTETLQASRAELRDCLKRMISQRLISMAQSEEKVQKQSPKIQARFRERIKAVLLSGLLLNAILTIILGVFFYRQIVKRLRMMKENSFRLAAGKELLPPVGGADEIAEVDVTFHRMANALAAAERKERSLIEHSLDLISSLDETGRITSINPACKEITGYSEEEMRGRNLRHILPPADVDALRKSLSSSSAEQAAIKFESSVMHKEGKDIHVSWSMHWVPAEREFFCVGHDITSRKETERLKQEFMAMVSHDLRTPLATLSNFIEMLETGLFGELSERGNHLVKVAASSANRMKSLINDLLDLDKAESGRLQLDCSLTRLDELLDQSVQSVRSLASKEEVQLDLKNIELEAVVDSKRMSQVLVNLLSNAIKFSSAGGVVTVSLHKQDGLAIISVSDQGRGVPDNMREAIFERFQQVKISDAVDKGGSGLGLAICKQIVELHGGTIKVENNQDRPGATFTFSVPLSNDKSI